MPGPVVADRQVAVPERHLDRAARAGSTSPRCRAGSRSRARGSPASRPSSSARARPRNGHVGVVAHRAPDRVLREQVEPHLLERVVLLLAARQLGQLGDQRRHLGELRDHVVRAACSRSSGGRLGPRREHLDVRPQARQRRAQLVRRVLDELALPLLRLVERLEHRVERRGEPAELVVAGHVDALGQVAGRAHALGRLAQAAYRLECCACDEEAEHERDPDPAERDQEQQPDLRQLAVDVRQRRAIRSANPGWVVSTRADPRLASRPLRVSQHATRCASAVPGCADTPHRSGTPGPDAVPSASTSWNGPCANGSRGSRNSSARNADVEADLHDPPRCFAARAVDLAAQLVLDDEVDDDRCERDGRGHRDRDDEAETRAEVWLRRRAGTSLGGPSARARAMRSRRRARCGSAAACRRSRSSSAGTRCRRRASSSRSRSRSPTRGRR